MNVYYHAIDFKVETISAEDVKFANYGAKETNLRTRVLHLEHKKQGVNEDDLEYYDTKLQLYLHAHDKGKRNTQEFKRLTLICLKNLEIMRCCWNKLRKWTVDCAAIRLTIEDQLTVQKN